MTEQYVCLDEFGDVRLQSCNQFTLMFMAQLHLVGYKKPSCCWESRSYCVVWRE